MTTATLEKPPVTIGTPHTSNAATRPATTKSKTILVGFDLGTNKSCVLAGAVTGTDILVSKVVPTVVGYVKDGIVDGIIAGNAQTIFGEDALRNMLHARLVAPVAKGVISDPTAARDFLQHLRSLVDPTGTAEIRAVIGVPANADAQSRDDIRTVARGQHDVHDKTTSMLAEMQRASERRRRLPGGRGGAPAPTGDAMVEAIGRSVTAMAGASQQLDALKTSTALPHEMTALNELLRAQAEVRRREVQQQHVEQAPMQRHGRAAHFVAVPQRPLASFRQIDPKCFRVRFLQRLPRRGLQAPDGGHDGLPR